jgi:hypothetical protein
MSRRRLVWGKFDVSPHKANQYSKRTANPSTLIRRGFDDDRPGCGCAQNRKIRKADANATIPMG